ncbi:alpha/beta fold hydrolase [Amnibacterium flavum]|uniref:Alpha/beta hydrolase n=1 Tax=Amnibacterium flavum TaxID=2173173 RepID=A0A2V1HNG3_9MICO|nr:alpha/beta hydrolase [Amnibacterium flavum]PVZ94173.1 alpha/beta hydrolase [Amnibacterium flavum]
MPSLERSFFRARDGVDLSYLSSAGGERTALFLHGLAGSAGEFVETARVLPELRTVILDLRGHGHSSRRPDDVSREVFVTDVVDAIESLGLGPVILIGQSMGAHTAMLVAATRPDLVERLILLEATAGGSAAADRADVAAFFRSWPVPFADAASALAFLGEGPLSRAWVADLERGADGLRPRFDVDVIAAILDGLAEPRWREWESIEVPSLVVFGENGMFTEQQKREFVERGKNAQRVDLVAAGHDAHLDSFEAWIEAIRDFVDPVRADTKAIAPGDD